MKKLGLLAVIAVISGMTADNSSAMHTPDDLRALSQWIMCGKADADISSYDINGDNSIDIFDMCLMRKEIAASMRNTVRVTDTEELKAALASAKPGDEIIASPGTYVYSGSTPKGRMFTGEADGLPDMPIILRSEDPDDPAILSGINIEGSYVLTILGDYWEVRDLKITNASKGIIVDNSNHTKIIGCEVYNIGMEGIHFRDDSSYCLAENCFVHNTGLVKPGYGEAIYVGSSKSTTGYGYNCDYNTIRSCRLGPNVAAEHVDVKEYTTGTLIENCTFDGKGMSGENSADSFVDLKGNDCILRNCVGYRNGCENINRAFEMNRLVEGWGLNAYIYGNRVYMDTAVNSLGKKMVIVNSWNCTETVWGNYMAYEDGELFYTDNEADRTKYYNCSDLIYGDPSIEASLGR